MKSITIKKPDGTLIMKVLHQKNGQFELELIREAEHWIIEVRDDNNKKVYMK